MKNAIRIERDLFLAAERIATRRKLRPATVLNLSAAEGLRILYPAEAAEAGQGNPPQLAEQAA